MNLNKILYITILFIGTSFTLQAQQTTIEWLTWEEAIEKSKVEKRKIFVDVYTEWCGWCKRMDKATFQKPQIVRFVNEHFYAVKLDAEQKEAIEFGGKTFNYVQNGQRGYHELAVAITHGQLSFPTIVFIDENLAIIQSIPGFRDPMEFEMIMTYFGWNEYKEQPWSLYQKNYQPLRKKKKEALPILPVSHDGN